MKLTITPTQRDNLLGRDDVIVTKTNHTDSVTAVNSTSFQTTDFPESKVLGVQHNIVRHPHTELDNVLKSNEARFRFILENDLVGIATVIDRVFQWVNPAYERMLGYARGELNGVSARVLYRNEEEYLEFGEKYKSELKEGKVLRTEFEFCRKDGSLITVDLYGSVLNPSTGESLWIYSDITVRKKSENKLRESESRFRTIMDHAPIGIGITSFKGGFIQCNRHLCEMVGRTRDELEKMSISEISHPDDRLISTENLQSLINGENNSVTYEKRYLHKDGHVIWVQLSVTLEVDAAGIPLYFIGMTEDITERKLSALKLKRSEMEYRHLVDALPYGVLIHSDGKIKLANQAAAKLFGASKSIELLGLQPTQLVHPDYHGIVKERIYSATEKHQDSGLIEEKLIKLDGSVFDAEVASISAEFEGIPSSLAIFNDISERKKSVQMIWHQANYDLLTGLPNRALFFDRLSQEISKARRINKCVALLFLDLDGFKPINDKFGHISGDEVLITVAKRWQSSVREMDTVVRLGGDEFAVILGEIDTQNEAATVARKLLGALTTEIVLANDQKCIVGTSIGISIYPSNASEMDSLIVAADEAMYESKINGKNKYTFSNRENILKEVKEDWIEFDSLNLVGIAIVDEQHRELIRKVNNLNKAIAANLDDDKTTELLEELINLSIVHFDTEFRIMKEINYPKLFEHESEHNIFLSELTQLVADFHHGKELLVLQLMKDWFINHIQHADKQWSDFFATKVAL